MPQRAGAVKAGAPPSWGCYVAVADVEASAREAAGLGGQILAGPTAMGPGMFALVRDPAGGLFMLWHAPGSGRTTLYGEPGALAWNELASADVGAAKRFYTQLLGWKAEPFGADQSYIVFKQGDVGVAGLLAQPDPKDAGRSFWATYFGVAAADATFAKALALGAQAMIPPTSLPDVGRFAWLRDPQGAVFAILESAPRT
jgi:predicted enzyme related to lactoylglutathione lyase